jgi:tetratricopeptide (TPR) repeat protein
MSTPLARDSARNEALKAWRIDSTLPQVHVILSRLADDPRVRVRELERAVALNPNLPEAKMELATAQAALGQGRQAMQQAREAARLDPLGARSRTSYREVMVLAGHPDEAMPMPPMPPVPGVAPAATPAGVPGPADVAMIHADVCVGLSQNPWPRAREAAGAECLRARTLAGEDPRVLGRVALGYARTGRRADALAALDAYQRVAEDDPRQPLTLAAVYGALGDLDRAFGALANVEPQQLREYLRDPTLAPLRLDARFPQLERRAAG